ncbi:hypothetical protein QFZ97_004585 [Paraburkholderia youngii]
MSQLGLGLDLSIKRPFTQRRIAILPWEDLAVTGAGQLMIRDYWARYPPSITSSLPVTNDASSLARNTHPAATS